MALIVGNTAANNTGDVLSALSTSGDEVRGLSGNDTIYGGPGRDTLNGNEDNDILFGGSTTGTASGNDSIFGGSGSDTVVGSQFGFGGDSLNGNKGDDIVIASAFGGDRLFGGQDQDKIYGSSNPGSDTLIGNLGDDSLYAGVGGDRLFGEDGADALYGSIGSEVMTGGTGADDFVFQPVVTKTIAGINVTEGGYGGTDTITDFNTSNGGQSDIIDLKLLDFSTSVTAAAQGSDVLITVSGSTNDGTAVNQKILVQNQTVLGVVGVNSVFVNGAAFNTTNATQNVDGSFTFGGLSNVSGKTINGTDVADDIGTAANPNSFFNPTVNNDTIFGNGGNDVLDGLAGNDIISGGNGADTLIGNSGNDSLVGNDGDDRLFGGPGVDTMTGGSGDDTFRFASINHGVDLITDFINSFTVSDIISVNQTGFALLSTDLINPGNIVLPSDILKSEVGTAFGAPDGTGAENTTVTNSPVGFYTNLTPAFYIDYAGGGVYYDADGIGGASDWQQFAVLNTAPGFVGFGITNDNAFTDPNFYFNVYT